MEDKQIGMNRMIPYPPSFKRIAARIMDPSSGASTWALGSHKWIKYIGILMRKASIINITIEHFIIIIMDNVKDIFIHKIIIINKGREAVIVYIIK